MAIIQYSNGIIEDVKPQNLVFTDQELLDILDGFEKIDTFRLLDVVNTWCVWGKNSVDDPEEYNRLGSSIAGEDIYSPMLIIHDSELDPSWNISDKIIINTYKQFREDVLGLIDDLAKQLLEIEDEMEIDEDEGLYGHRDTGIQLTTLGPTQDKKVLFEFDLAKQSADFHKYENISKFAEKVIGYWDQFFFVNIEINDNTCVIYADKKIIIILKDENVSEFFELMRDFFEKDESFETCINLQEYESKWNEYIAADKKVKVVDSSDDETSDEK